MVAVHVFHVFLYCHAVFFVVASARKENMHIREQFQRLVDRKQQEIRNLELQIEKARTYVEALQDSMRLLPKEVTAGSEATLRPDTALARTRDILRTAGKPMHINDLLKALGSPADSKHKLSLGGSLANYVRKGQIFTRPAPNTFGLIEMSQKGESKIEDEIPEDFGSD
jgi:hypothetical protein